MKYKFSKELYSKIALIKSAYSFIDKAFVHLDADEFYYYVDLEMKDGIDGVREQDFINEMLAQAVRHEIYLQTKDIRELMLARAMATSIVADSTDTEDDEYEDYSEDAILKDWFESNDT